MGTKPFSEHYARYYDLYYRDKPYEDEVDYLEWIFRKHAVREVRTILDFGCGTGGHATLLGGRGYAVTGVDRSLPMIRRARERVRSMGVNAVFAVGDIRSYNIGRKFDACVALFAVIDYLLSDSDLSRALSNARRHLYRGSLLIFDYWHAPAVLAIRPSVRLVRKQDGSTEALRLAVPKLDSKNRRNVTTYLCMIMEHGELAGVFTERHEVRFFGREELGRCLRASGFRVRSHLAFLQHQKPPDRSTWNATCIAEAV